MRYLDPDKRNESQAGEKLVSNESACGLLTENMKVTTEKSPAPRELAGRIVYAEERKKSKRINSQLLIPKNKDP